MSTSLTVAQNALENMDSNASMISIDIGRLMLDAGVNPMAVKAIAEHYPKGGPSVEGWRWAFSMLADARLPETTGYYADAAAAGYYETD